MKKFILVCMISFLVLICSTLAAIAQGTYVSANLATGFLMDSDIAEPGFFGEAEFDAGWGVGAAIGFTSGPGRLEGEISYQKNDFDNVSSGGIGLNSTGDITSTSFLVNGYYDFPTNSALVPYITAGIGFARLEINDLAILGSPVGNSDDDVLAYQVGFGVGYSINKQVTLDLKYRFFATADPNFDGTDAEYRSHNILLGIRYNF